MVYFMSMPHDEVEVCHNGTAVVSEKHWFNTNEKEVSYYVRNHCNGWKAV